VTGEVLIQCARERNHKEARRTAVLALPAWPTLGQPSLSRSADLPDVLSLLWFHVFDRNTPRAIVQVLRDGPAPNPNPLAKTKENEDELGIAPSCVYAYLGAVSDKFGQRAVVARQGWLNGYVSPFDTGGLVKKINPVNGWSQNDRRAFLNAYTWDASALPDLLALYPGIDVEGYVRGDCPAESGPHERFVNRDAQADIWAGSANTWQAWTWEGRAPAQLPVGDDLVAWTCDTDEYLDLIDELEEDPAGTVTAGTIKAIADKHRDGGVTGLMTNRFTLQGVTNA
jgi:hypothetical protein